MVGNTNWQIVRESEEDGLAASMTSIIERYRTALNEQLSDYFRENIPMYTGTYLDTNAEEVLDAINDYIEENGINLSPLDFPIPSGTTIHLLPITENLKLKVMIVDEYSGGGESEQYVDISFFLINENTTKKDVDALIGFVREYLTVS